MQSEIRDKQVASESPTVTVALVGKDISWGPLFCPKRAILKENLGESPRRLLEL